MTSVLEALYRTASYRARLNGIDVPFRINVPSPELAEFMAARKARTAVFITAWNPRSQPMSQSFNDARQGELEKALLVLGAYCVHGTGQGDGWKEEHFLALGVSREMAEGLGQHFEQNAIVWIEPDGIPRLVMLTLPE